MRHGKAKSSKRAGCAGALDLLLSLGERRRLLRPGKPLGARKAFKGKRQRGTTWAPQPLDFPGSFAPLAANFGPYGPQLQAKLVAVNHSSSPGSPIGPWSTLSNVAFQTPLSLRCRWSTSRSCYPATLATLTNPLKVFPEATPVVPCKRRKCKASD